jgi:hypothetical protein
MQVGAPRNPFAVEGFSPVWRNESAELTKVQNALPRAYAVDSISLVQSLDAAIKTLSDHRFDPTRTAVVEGKLDQPPAAADPHPPRIEWIRDDPLDLEIAVTSDHPTFLVIADLWFPAWLGQIDGVASPVYPTDVMFRGMTLPAGEHRVHLFFDLRRYIVGGAISTITALSFVGWTFVVARNHFLRRSKFSSADQTNRPRT